MFIVVLGDRDSQQVVIEADVYIVFSSRPASSKVAVTPEFCQNPLAIPSRMLVGGQESGETSACRAAMDVLLPGARLSSESSAVVRRLGWISSKTVKLVEILVEKRRRHGGLEMATCFTDILKGD